MNVLNYIWGSGKKENPENENAELAMREALDAKGDFFIKEDMTMGIDDFIIFRSIIERQALRHNFEENQKLKAQSVELYKKNPTSEDYAKNFEMMFRKVAEAGKHMTAQACDWIDYDFKNFHLTMQGLMKEEAKEDAKKLQEKMQEVHAAFRKEKFVFQGDEAKALEIYQWRIRQDIEMNKKMMLQKYMSPPQIIQSYAKLEAQKISDQMMIQFGVDQDYLSSAIESMKLYENQKFKTLQELCKKQMQAEEKKFVESCIPNAEQKAAYLKKAKDFGKPEFKSDQTMTFDFFLKTKLYSLEKCVEQMQGVFDQMQAERRELFKKIKEEDNKEEYSLALIKRVAMQTIAERSFDGILYQELKVQEKIYAKSLQSYMMDPEKRKTFEEETEKIREKVRNYKAKEMTREQVLDCVQRLEDFKFKAQIKMYTIVRMQQMPPEMINTVIMFEKEQADDQFFFDTGFQEEDVDFNIKRLKMEEDEEYKKITSEWQKKSQGFLEERQKEAAMQMAKQRAHIEKMKKAKQEASSIETTPAESQMAEMADVNALLM